MVRGSINVAIVAVVLSLLLHALGLRFGASEDRSRAPDERAPDVTDTGRSFEDFAEVATDAAEPEPTPTPDPPEVTPPEQVTAETPMTRALVESDNPQDVLTPGTGTDDVVEPDNVDLPVEEAVAPETAEQSGGEDDRVEDIAVLKPLDPDREAAEAKGTSDEDADPTASQPEEATTASQPEEATTASQPEEATVVPPAEAVSPDAPSPSAGVTITPDPEAQQPVLPEVPVTPVPDEPETLAAEPDSDEPTGPAVTTSLRPPKERPPAPASGAPDGTQTGRASGTVESPLTAYKRTGIDPFASGSNGDRSATTGFSGSRNPGNASTTNYAGRVLVQLNRSRVVYPSARGVARVSFEINPDGTVGWVSILASSGSSDIERAAAAQVRSAGPFPPPPQGTSQRLVFVYRNR